MEAEYKNLRIKSSLFLKRLQPYLETKTEFIISIAIKNIMLSSSKKPNPTKEDKSPWFEGGLNTSVSSDYQSD